MDGHGAVGVEGRIVAAGLHAEHRLRTAVEIQTAVGVESVAVTVHIQIAAVDIDVIVARGGRTAASGVEAAASGTVTAASGIEGVAAARAGIGAVAAAARGVYAVVARDHIIASGIDINRAALESFVRIVDRDVGIAVIAVFGAEDERGVAMHAVVACLDSKGTSGHGRVRVGVDRVVARVQREATACDIQSGLDACLFRSIAGGFQALTTVRIGKGIIPYAVTLPCLDIKGTAVDIQLGICLYTVAVNINVKGTAVDRDRTRGISVDGSSFGCIRRVGSALDAVVGGFDDKCSLIDDDTAVAGDAVIDSRARGRSSIVFAAA